MLVQQDPIAAHVLAESVRIFHPSEAAKAIQSTDVTASTATHVTDVTTADEPEESSPSKRPRSFRCNCPGCVAPDCGVCKNCLDKPSFGGLGIKKRKCVRRKCINPPPSLEVAERKAAAEWGSTG